MYRSDDGGESWTSIEEGLPSTFGFPAAAHPRDPDALFLFPLNGASRAAIAPEGRPAVWKTSDGGAHWRGAARGLPQSDAYFGVLRQAMATDRSTPAGVYFGATNGAVYASADEGESWTRIAENLPAISSVETLGRSSVTARRRQAGAGAPAGGADGAVSRRPRVVELRRRASRS